MVVRLVAGVAMPMAPASRAGRGSARNTERSAVHGGMEFRPGYATEGFRRRSARPARRRSYHRVAGGAERISCRFLLPNKSKSAEQ